MKRYVYLLTPAILLSFSTGCRHAELRETEKPATEQAKESNAKAGTIAPKKARLAESAPKSKPVELKPISESGIPLALSPADALTPQAGGQIQQALASRGFPTNNSGKFDATTSEKLRDFQEREGLPRTGAPDRETLRHLGLNPDECLKRKPDTASIP